MSRPQHWLPQAPRHLQTFQRPPPQPLAWHPGRSRSARLWALAAAGSAKRGHPPPATSPVGLPGSANRTTAKESSEQILSTAHGGLWFQVAPPPVRVAPTPAMAAARLFSQGGCFCFLQGGCTGGGGCWVGDFRGQYRREWVGVRGVRGAAGRIGRGHTDLGWGSSSPLLDPLRSESYAHSFISSFIYCKRTCSWMPSVPQRPFSTWCVYWGWYASSSPLLPDAQDASLSLSHPPLRLSLCLSPLSASLSLAPSLPRSPLPPSPHTHTRPPRGRQP